MTLRFAAAAALFALTTAGLGSAAQAAPSCTVTVMGLTFNNCTSETPATVANVSDQARAWTSGSVRADVIEAGAVTHRPAAR